MFSNLNVQLASHLSFFHLWEICMSLLQQADARKVQEAQNAEAEESHEK